MTKQDGAVKVAAMGLDVHYKFSSVTMRDGQGQVVARERLEHRDRKALRERLAQWPKGVPAVVEASFGWSWLSDEMLAAGLDVQLSNCYKVEKMRQAHGGAKTNKKDADLLSLLPWEVKPWWRIWLVPPEVRNQREWMRYRGDLVGVQTQTKSRICAVFHRHGIFHEFSDLFAGRGRAFLAELCREGKHAGGELPPGALAALRGQVRLLDQIRAQLAEVARKLRDDLTNDEVTRRLAGIPGIGRILSHVLKAEIGQIERFGGNHNRLACYSLLGPRADDTGEQDPTKSPWQPDAEVGVHRGGARGGVSRRPVPRPVRPCDQGGEDGPQPWVHPGCARTSESRDGHLEEWNNVSRGAAGASRQRQAGQGLCRVITS